LMMNPFSWLQMTNMISYQGLVRTFLWLCEGAVQGAAQERQPTGDVVYAGESVSRGPDDTGMG
ncbi:hypothetical protein, partial [Aeromonas veronii]|uniref:hypothetical protein n=1 Tax=Aeromonas veronii TaxID=654 RepID=UPI003BA3448A